jgi:hypothetical protein
VQTSLSTIDLEPSSRVVVGRKDTVKWPCLITVNLSPQAYFRSPQK